MSFESLQLFHFRKKESHVESLQLQVSRTLSALFGYKGMLEIYKGQEN